MRAELKAILPTHVNGKKVAGWKDLVYEDRVKLWDVYYDIYSIAKYHINTEINKNSEDGSYPMGQYFGTEDNLKEYSPVRPIFKLKLG